MHSTPIPILDNPIDLFRGWMAEAREAGIKYSNAMALATVDEQGQPDVRMVLLKDLTDRGFVFFTNFHSAKGRQLLATKKAALCFYWEPPGKQVRVRGTVEVVSKEEADAYFATRPRLSRLGAWASAQSEEIPGRGVLESRVAELETKYKGQDVPRPAHWAGFRLLPEEIEFWKEGDYRLHDRLLYRKTADGAWETRWLAP